MRIEHLREFVVLARYLNFTSAARELGMAQPTLSGHIADTERELGVALFDRDRQRVELTPVGRALLTDANRVVGDYQKLCTRARTLRKEPPVKVRVMTYAGHRSIEESLQAAERLVRKEMPLFEVELVDMAHDNLLGPLRAGEVDVVLLLLNFAIDDPALHVERIAPDPLVAIVPRGETLDAPEPLQPGELDGRTVLVPSFSTDRRLADGVRALLAERGVRPAVQEYYFDTIQELYQRDFEGGVFVDSLHAAASLPLFQRDAYRVRRFADPGLCFWDAAVWRANSKNPGIEPLVRELGRLLEAF